MDLTEARALLSRMGQKAPRQAVETLLEFLATSHAADGAAVFRAEADRLSLFFSRSMGQAALDWTHETWHRQALKLASGFEIREGYQSLIPILRAKALVGVLYLEAPAIHMEMVFDVSAQLADAIYHSRGAVAQGAVDAYLEATPEEEIQRQKIRLLLMKHEHNLSRVARILCLSRNALYRRMEVLGIERERVLKGTR